MNHPTWRVVRAVGRRLDGPDIAAAETAYRDGMARHGMHFAPYEGATDWGITLHSRAWVESAVRSVSAGALIALGFRPRGWDDHQDVFSFRLGRPSSGRGSGSTTGVPVAAFVPTCTGTP